MPFAIAMPAVVIITWCVLTLGRNPIVSPLFLPSPIVVLQATLQMIFEHTLFGAIWASTLRILISFVAAAAVALPLGIFMGAFEPINRLMEPVMAPLRYMPIIRVHSAVDPVARASASRRRSRSSFSACSSICCRSW